MGTCASARAVSSPSCTVLTLYRGEPLGPIASRALLEAFAQALMDALTKAPRMADLETRRRQDEEVAFDRQARERWLDDGAMVCW